MLNAARRLAYPVSSKESYVSSGYGMRWGRKHEGLDIAADNGTPVVAAYDGVVEYASHCGAYGNLVCIEHASGFSTR